MKRYLTSLAALLVVFAIAFGSFFYVVLRETDRALLNEKVIERQTDLDLICAQVDKFIELDEDWGQYDYAKIIGHTLTVLDNVDMTFAAAYDEQLKEVSTRAPSYEGAPFDPTIYPEFIEAIQQAQSGQIALWFENTEHGVKGRDMMTCWRWIPTDETLEGRFLMVVAVSQYSVVTHPLQWAWLGIAALIIFTGATCFMYVFMLAGSRSPTRKGGTSQ